MRQSGTRRTARVNEALHAIIAEILLKDVEDPRLKAVVITGVEVSVDLRHARVYYALSGNEVSRTEVNRALARASGFIKRSVSSQVTMRYMPELMFKYDDSVAEGDRIERLLRGLKVAGASDV